jgi:hypothetical protein
MFRQNCRVEESREENFVIAATKKIAADRLRRNRRLLYPAKDNQTQPIYLRQECMHRCHAPLRTAHE